MSEQHSQCLFSEGLINVPEGYQDRTVNVFAPPAADAPAFNISRDALNPGEALAAYIDRQLALMAKHIKGWKQGLAGHTVGSQVLLVVPPSLGYGNKDQEKIPANSTLVFVVDILAAY